VAGSTELVQRDETLAHERITQVFAAFADCIRRYGGIVHEIRGDALVAEFERVSDAIAGALAAQTVSAEYNAQFSDDILPQLRVGIALGEVVIADSTVTGPGIVLAQRLEQLAAPGGVCVQGSVYEAVPQRLPYAFSNLGDHSLKGFDEPVRAFSVALAPDSALPLPDTGNAAAIRTARLLLRSGVFGVAALIAAGWFAITYYSGDDANQSERNSATVDQTAQVTPSVDDGAGELPGTSRGVEHTHETRRSIAVLPFVNMSNDPNQSYFSDGLTEDIITDLARISGLFVIARHSSFVYKGRAVDAKTVGHELGVRYIVEGSVRRAGERIRITAQLIDAESGMHLWAERYDRQLIEVFALQDEVTQIIVEALSVNLTAEESEQLAAPQNVGTAAYDLLLRGNAAMSSFSPQAMVDARAIYEKVVAENPGYARAHANIAFAYAQDALFGWATDHGDTVRRGFAAAEEARRLDDRIPQVHLTLSALHGARLEWDESAQSALRAVELEPSYADGFAMLAVARTFLGELDGATEAITAAKRLNPHYSFIYQWVEGRILYFRRHYDAAVVLLEDAAERNPEFDQVHIVLAATYAKLGRTDDAEWEAEQILLLRPDFTIASDVEIRGFRDAELQALYVDGLRGAGLPE
jgi:TolB-like protein